MKLEDQVCSLSLAKRLKELGVKQESYFRWWHMTDPFNIEPSSWRIEHGLPDEAKGETAAFTVAELGEMLRGRGMGTTAFSPMTGKWWVAGGEWLVGKQAYAHTVDDAKEADARAKMLLHLIENKLVTP